MKNMPSGFFFNKEADFLTDLLMKNEKIEKKVKKNPEL